MKNYKLWLAILIMLFASLLLISKLFDKTPKEIKEAPITSETTISSTTTTTHKKTTKKVVKTTKKVTSVKKVVQMSKQEYLNYAKSYGNLNNTQLTCLDYLWQHESGWNPNSVNSSSGACGIPQAYPCNKIKNSEGSNEWQAQIRWGIKYINARYKNPCSAWNHFKNKHWY